MGPASSRTNKVFKIADVIASWISATGLFTKDVKETSSIGGFRGGSEAQ